MLLQTVFASISMRASEGRECPEDGHLLGWHDAVYLNGSHLKDLSISDTRFQSRPSCARIIRVRIDLSLIHI